MDPLKERIYPRVRSYIQSAERRRERISEQHRTPLERYVTYPAYKTLTGFGEWWRGGMERWEGVPRIREKIWETPGARELAKFGTGVVRSRSNGRIRGTDTDRDRVCDTRTQVIPRISAGWQRNNGERDGSGIQRKTF